MEEDGTLHTLKIFKWIGRTIFLFSLIFFFVFYKLHSDNVLYVVSSMLPYLAFGLISFQMVFAFYSSMLVKKKEHMDNFIVAFLGRVKTETQVFAFFYGIVLLILFVLKYSLLKKI